MAETTARADLSTGRNKTKMRGGGDRRISKRTRKSGKGRDRELHPNDVSFEEYFIVVVARSFQSWNAKNTQNNRFWQITRNPCCLFLLWLFTMPSCRYFGLYVWRTHLIVISLLVVVVCGCYTQSVKIFANTLYARIQRHVPPKHVTYIQNTKMANIVQISIGYWMSFDTSRACVIMKNLREFVLA